MNELQTAYKDKVDFVLFDLNTTEGYCEFLKNNFEHIPAMLYYSKSNRQIERTDTVQEKEPLQARLENLLKQP